MIVEPPNAGTYEGPEPSGALAHRLCADVLTFAEGAGFGDFHRWTRIPGVRPGDDPEARSRAIQAFVVSEISGMSRRLFAAASGRGLVLRTFARWARNDQPITGDALDRMTVREIREVYTACCWTWVDLGFFHDLPLPSAPREPVESPTTD